MVSGQAGEVAYIDMLMHALFMLVLLFEICKCHAGPACNSVQLCTIQMTAQV